MIVTGAANRASDGVSRSVLLSWTGSLAVHGFAAVVLFGVRGPEVSVLDGRTAGALPAVRASFDTRVVEDPNEEQDRGSAVLEQEAVARSEAAREMPRTKRLFPEERTLVQRPSSFGGTQQPRRSASFSDVRVLPPEPALDSSRRATRETDDVTAQMLASLKSLRQPKERERTRAESVEVPALEEVGRDAPQEDVADENQPPSYAYNPPPVYPAEAVRRGLAGRVLLTVSVGADGLVERVELSASSGHAMLDRAAVKAVQGWRFRPAHRLGQAIGARVRVPVQFRLED